MLFATYPSLHSSFLPDVSVLCIPLFLHPRLLSNMKCHCYISLPSDAHVLHIPPSIHPRILSQHEISLYIHIPRAKLAEMKPNIDWTVQIWVGWCNCMWTILQKLSHAESEQNMDGCPRKTIFPFCEILLMASYSSLTGDYFSDLSAHHWYLNCLWRLIKIWMGVLPKESDGALIVHSR